MMGHFFLGFLIPFVIILFVSIIIFVVSKRQKKNSSTHNFSHSEDKRHKHEPSHNHDGPSKTTMWTAHIITVIFILAAGYVAIRIISWIFNSGPTVVEHFFGR